MEAIRAKSSLSEVQKAPYKPNSPHIVTEQNEAASWMLLTCLALRKSSWFLQVPPNIHPRQQGTHLLQETLLLPVGLLLMLRRKGLVRRESTGLPRSPRLQCSASYRRRKHVYVWNVGQSVRLVAANWMNPLCHGYAEVPLSPGRPYHCAMYFVMISAHCMQNATTEMVSYASAEWLWKKISANIW